MPMPIIPTSLFPLVPLLPGVPPLKRVNQVLNVVTTVQRVAGLIRDAFLGPQWGIFSAQGEPILIGDSVLAFDYRTEERTPDYPIEEGEFASYNKVQQPFEGKVTFVKGGDTDARREFLDQAHDLMRSLELYTIVTPDYVYENVSINHIDFRRSSRKGVTLLEVDIWCSEIRIVAAGEFTDSKQPSGATPTDAGTVQPVQTTTGTERYGPPAPAPAATSTTPPVNNAPPAAPEAYSVSPAEYAGGYFTLPSTTAPVPPPPAATAAPALTPESAAAVAGFQ